ncbi:hypothetical protein ACMFMG_011445 [Clarireedia jacksonii]
MESPAKRQKVFAETDDGEAYSTTEEDDFTDDNDFIIDDSGYNPDEELQRKRAHLDFKLKSTFEAIFEKYGKDFDGVGDEIDLRTGEIVVDNGHLAEIQDERDAGERRAGGNLLRALTVEPESTTESFTESLTGNSGDEDDEVDEVDAQNDILDAADLNDGDMLEDDMILRGCEDSGLGPFVDEPTTTTVPTFRHESKTEVQQSGKPRPDSKAALFPSYNELLKSFGPDVAPQIVNIIARQQVQDDSHIEPAWRAPSIPLAPAGKRPTLRTYVPQLEIEGTPSPELSESVWALPKGPGRRKHISKDSTSLHSDNQGEISLTKSRNNFTAEDDEFLIARVAEAQKQGMRFGKETFWKRIADENPRHGGRTWKNRYRAKYWHLWTGNESARPHVFGGIDEEAELDTEFHLNNAHSGPIFQRSAGVLKPRQQGPDVVSWSDAVATIRTLDRRLHKDLIRDAHAYDFSDIGHMRNDYDGSNFGISGHESLEKADDEPELPTPIAPAVQRIAPVAVNPLYEFSDEEAIPPTLAALPVNTPIAEVKKRPRKPRTTKLKDGSGKQTKSRVSQTKVLLASDDLDELSLGADDGFYNCSLPKTKKSKSPASATSVKREETRGSREDAPVTIQPQSAKRALPPSSILEELDELGAEWAPSASASAHRLQKPMRRNVADPTNELTGSSSKKPKDHKIDLFDVKHLPDTSPTSALETRTKAKAHRKDSLNGVSSAQLSSSPSNTMRLPNKTGKKRKRSDANEHLVAHTSSKQLSPAIGPVCDARVKARTSGRPQGAEDEFVVPSTSPQVESSSTPRPERRVSETEKGGLLCATPPKASNRNSPPVTQLLASQEGALLHHPRV